MEWDPEREAGVGVKVMHGGCHLTLLSVYCKPGMVSSILGALYHFILFNKCLHVTEQETAAQSYTVVSFSAALEYG